VTILRDVEVGAPAHGGHCVARVDGHVVFVRHSAPGEVVDVRVTERRRRYWRGEAIAVHRAAADRVPSIWPEAGPGGVGGGELAHLRLPAQRAWKTQVLHDTMRRIGGIDLADHGLAAQRVGSIEAPGQDDGLATRTRVQLVTTEAGHAGMYRHRSHDVLALTDLPLAALDTEELLRPGRWRKYPAGTRLTAVTPSDGPGVVLAGEEVAVGRSRYVRERVAWQGNELTFRVAASGFWQVHHRAPQALMAAVMAAAAPQAGEAILELFSGAGLFTLPLADAVGPGGAVHALEGSDQAVRDARRNLHQQPWARLHHGVVDPASVAAFERADVVVLDPPRRGAGGDVMAAIAQLRPRVVVYVACDPAALARDVRAAHAHGMRLASLEAFDLFPHTHHFEAIATLVPTGVPHGLTSTHKVS